MEMDLSYEAMFTEDERTLFGNRTPTSEDMRRLKELNRNIRLAVAEDSVQGYKMAAKLHNAKLKLLKGEGAHS